jgi:hypothetical protein
MDRLPPPFGIRVRDLRQVEHGFHCATEVRVVFDGDEVAADETYGFAGRIEQRLAGVDPQGVLGVVLILGPDQLNRYPRSIGRGKDQQRIRTPRTQQHRDGFVASAGKRSNDRAALRIIVGEDGVDDDLAGRRGGRACPCRKAARDQQNEKAREAMHGCAACLQELCQRKGGPEFSSPPEEEFAVN